MKTDYEIIGGRRPNGNVVVARRREKKEKNYRHPPEDRDDGPAARTINGGGVSFEWGRGGKMGDLSRVRVVRVG